MQNHEGRVGVKVCVTGAGGYIGSWLVKNLLQRGYTVNATLRNPKNEAKTGPLLSLPGAAERLKLFQADLCEEGTFDSAVEGPMDFSKLSEDDFVQPIACSNGEARGLYFIGGFSLDESKWTPVDFLRRKPHPINFYTLAKTLAEKAAIEYGLNSDQMEVVTIGPGFVGGPSISSTFPISCGQIISPITGNYEGLKLCESFLGSIPLVHIDDVCEAHIFLMEQPNVQGRHICAVRCLTLSQLADFIHKRYPHFTLQFKSDVEDENGILVPTCSQKLLDMGFSYQYNVEGIFDETIQCA